MKTTLTPLLLFLACITKGQEIYESDYITDQAYLALEVEPVWQNMMTQSAIKVERRNGSSLMAYLSENEVVTQDANGSWGNTSTAPAKEAASTLFFEGDELTILDQVSINDTTQIALTEYDALISYDNGANWVATNDPFNGLTGMIKTRSGKLFAHAKSDVNIYLYEPDKNNWKIHVSLSYYPTCLATFFEQGIAVGTSGGGTYLSLNDGMAWVYYSYGADYATVNDLLVDGNTIYAATTNGIYETTLPGTSATEATGDEIELALAEGINEGSVLLFKQSKNAGPETVISQESIPNGEGYTNFSMEIPKNGTYNISIYSAGGQAVPLVTSAELDKGTYTMQFYNSSYKGVFYLHVEDANDYHMVACLLK